MKKFLNTVAILLIYIGIIFINTKVYATTAKVTQETVRLRKEASTSSSVVELVSQNEEVTVLSKEGEWYKVEYKKDGTTYSGYIREDMLKVEENQAEDNVEQNQTTDNIEQNQTIEQATAQTENTQNNQENNDANTNQTDIANNQTTDAVSVTKGYTAKTTQNLKIKILPTINSEIIAEVGLDTEYTVKEIINKWCYIEAGDKSGWILISKLNITANNNVQNGEIPNTNNEETSNQTDDQSNTADNVTEANSQNDQNTQSNNDDQNTQSQENTSSETQETAANEAKVKYVSAETLNLREKAETDAKILQQLDRNAKVTVVEVVDSTWSKVKANGLTGYVASKYLSDTITQVTSRSEEPSRANQVSANQETTSSNESQQDAKENTENNASTSNNEEASSNVGTSATGVNIVEFSKKYLGYKYVSGGASPEAGFDCSGFTTYVYKNFGITLSRTSTAQASNGTAVQKSNLKQGDLVIFNNSSNTKVGHVGIYIGDNKFIHAANPSKGVIITSLSDSYYSARYVGARRIIN